MTLTARRWFSGLCALLAAVLPAKADTRLEIVHRFPSGNGLVARPIQGADGNFYGTTEGGGTLGLGTVYKVTADGQITELTSFDNVLGAHPRSSLVATADGHLLGTAYAGGAGFGTVFVRSPLGTFSTLVSFNGTNGAAPSANLCDGGDGFYYGTTSAGGSANAGTLFKVKLDGTFVSLFSFSGPNGSSPRGALIKASDGAFYGTTAGGGNFGMGTVFKYTTGGGLTVVRHFDGTAGDTPVYAVAEGPDGFLYGTLTGHQNFFRMAKDGTPSAWINQQGLQINGPLTVGPDGDLYGTELTKAFKISPDGNLIDLVSFSGPTDDGLYFAAGGLVVGRDGALYGTANQKVAGHSSIIYKIAALGLVEIAGFKLPGEIQPIDALVQTGDGTLYGATSAGNLVGGQSQIAGTLFSVTPSGNFTTFRSFPFRTPHGSMVLDTFGGVSLWQIDSSSSLPPLAGFTQIPLSGLAPGGALSSDQTDFKIAYTGNAPGTLTGDGSMIFATVTGIYRDTPSPNKSSPTSFTLTKLNATVANGGLVLASDGNYYGTQPGGGDHDSGAIFRMSAAGAVTLLYSFDGTSAGTPQEGLLLGSDGILYGTTSNGGTGAAGIVFSFTTDGQFTVLHNFTGTGDGAAPVGLLVEGADARLYGATSLGGDSSCGTLYAMAKDGTFASLYSFDGRAAATPTGGPIFGLDGALYGNAKQAVYRLLLNVSPLAPQPTVATVGAAGVSLAGTTLQGAANANGLTGASTYFQLSTDPGFPDGNTRTTSPVSLAAGAGEVSRSEAVTSLVPNTTYYLRFVLQAGATTVQGEPVSIPVGDVSAAIQPAGGVASGSAVLKGTVDPYGTATQAAFEYSTDAGFSAGLTHTTSPVFQVGASAGAVAVQSALSGLLPQTTYYFRLAATASGVTRRSTVLNFTTSVAVPLSVTTLAISNEQDFSAQLNGTVTGATNGPTALSFAYGSTTGYGNTITAQTVGSDGPFSITLGGLQPNTTYHYKAVATYGSTVATGADQSFFVNGDGGGDPGNPGGNGSTVTAADDVYNVTFDRTFYSFSVLDNDAASDNAHMEVTAVTDGVYGHVSIAPGGGTGGIRVVVAAQLVQYRPDSRFQGEDSFSYTVTSASGAVATAHVYLHSSLAVGAGTFDGLLESNPAGHVGMLQVTLTARGVYTGHWTDETSSKALRGRLTVDLDGTDTGSFFLPPGNATKVTIRYDQQAELLTATFLDGLGASTPVTLRRRAAFSVNSPTSLAGKYTLLLPAPGDTALPQGIGYAAGSVSAAGRVSLTGRLEDGAAFSAAGWLTEFGSGTLGLPLFARAYARPAGSLNGMLAFQEVSGISDLGGSLAWHRPARNHGSEWMRAAVSAAIPAVGSAYHPERDATVTAFGSDGPDGTLTFTGAGLASDAAVDVRLVKFNEAFRTAPWNTTLAINPATGLLGGTIGQRGSSSGTFRGVLFQKRNRAEGTLHRPEGLGSFLLQERVSGQ